MVPPGAHARHYPGRTGQVDVRDRAFATLTLLVTCESSDLILMNTMLDAAAVGGKKVAVGGRVPAAPDAPLPSGHALLSEYSGG